MYQTPERRDEVIDYYSYAPKLVTRVDALPEDLRENIYGAMNEKFIQPCVAAFAAGDSEGAYEKYKQLISFARGI